MQLNDGDVKFKIFFFSVWETLQLPFYSLKSQWFTFCEKFAQCPFCSHGCSYSHAVLSFPHPQAPRDILWYDASALLLLPGTNRGIKVGRLGSPILMCALAKACFSTLDLRVSKNQLENWFLNI